MSRQNARKSTTRHFGRALMVAALLASLTAGLVGGLTGCGQRGPLYMPNKDDPDKRR